MTPETAMGIGLRRLGHTEIADSVELERVVEVQNLLWMFNHKEEFMSKKCKSCGHYDLFDMITSGRPYGYGGAIPCDRCCEFSRPHSEYIPISQTLREIPALEPVTRRCELPKEVKA